MLLIFPCFLVRKGLSNDDVGVATGTVFQETRPGAGFQTRGLVKETPPSQILISTHATAWGAH